MSYRTRILYVEDDDELRNTVAEVLGFVGFDIETAVDGQDGLACFFRSPDSYDLVLTDLNMPRIDGLEMVEHIRGWGFDTPVIVHTSYDCDPFRRDIEALKIAAVIEKGDVASLVSGIARIMPTEFDRRPCLDRHLVWELC